MSPCISCDSRGQTFPAKTRDWPKGGERGSKRVQALASDLFLGHQLPLFEDLQMLRDRRAAQLEIGGERIDGGGSSA